MRDSHSLDRGTSRRQFLVGAAGLCGWLIDARLALQIGHAAREYGALLPAPVTHPRHTLWYEPACGTLTLDETMGASSSQLSWEEWYQLRGGGAEGARAILNEIAELDAAERFMSGSVTPDSGSELPGPYSEYLDWLVGRDITPATRAAEYLERFELANVHGAESAPMGSIVFLEGPRLGSTRSICALADGLEAVSGLQRRLLELGESIRVRIAPSMADYVPSGACRVFS